MASDKKKKNKTAAEIQQELKEATKGSGEERPPVDLKKIYLRVALVAAVVWAIAFIIPWRGALVIAGVLSAVAIGAMIWLDRWVKKSNQLGAILKGADTEEGRKEALAKLETDFKKNDTQALMAKAQLQMQDDPRAALATFEQINVDKEMAPIAAQVRAMRAMLHLNFGETMEARQLADQIDLGKQTDAKLRVLLATVASEAWARTGLGKKAVDTLELFNPDAPENAEQRPQMWRARAFAYAAVNDTKGISRALKKMADVNPHLLGMFLPPQKKVHPLLEREAKQMVQRMGLAKQKMVRQRM